MTKPLFLLPVSLLALISPALGAQYPYSPTALITAKNGSIAYLFSPQSDSSQSSLSLLNVSDTVGTTTKPTLLSAGLPFLDDAKSRPFIPLVDDAGITVLTGDCGTAAKGAELWRYTPTTDSAPGSWEQLQTTSGSGTLTANYLSAGVAFPASDGDATSALYIFGGMCPTTESPNEDEWISQANYSATMLALSPQDSSNAASSYTISSTGLRAPPIPEAGLTMTPLAAAFSNVASQQQNFVLIGGHTQSAFINMSQVALFSLPQASWAFVPIQQPAGHDNTELFRRDTTTVEPRSGHTAVLTQDGKRIIVLGGWVGDTETAAQPQIAVLNIGQEYGGEGDWSWTVPTSKLPFASDSGVFGHGAALLQGGVMAVFGGNFIGASGSKTRRQSGSSLFFLNTTSMQWMDSYTNPTSASALNVQSDPASAGLNKTEKIGIGTGIGLSAAALTIIVSIWFWYTRRLRSQRNFREKELRELALGAERACDPSFQGATDQRYPDQRSASWANMQEKTAESGARPGLPWHLGHDNDIRQAERTGVQMDVPSPTRGLRKNLQTRPNIPSYQQGGPPGGVFRIDEEDEDSQVGSLRKTRTPQKIADRSSTYSDPFKDPPGTADSSDPAAEQRRKEVQGWVEDWQSAAESILSRNPSQAQTNRTYSNLSQTYAYSNSTSNGNGSSLPSGRGSPEKSDRTGSNLSESSHYSQMSFQRSVPGTVSRDPSQRSASAGYSLFTGAAAAMGRMRGQSHGEITSSGVMREPSKRSVSARDYSTDQRQRARDRTEPTTAARNSMGAMYPDEGRALLGRLNTRVGGPEHVSTPPASPVKEPKYTRSSSLTRTGALAMGFLGSVKRVITGTGNVNVHDRITTFENKSSSSSPTKTNRDTSPKRPLSPSQEFWKGKQGAKDWEGGTRPGTVRRKTLPTQMGAPYNGDDDDWDIEGAVQDRVVQVMFTVPKEKLRVVNADALSLLSSNRSDADHEDDKDREREVKRMSSVREADEMDVVVKGKETAWDRR